METSPRFEGPITDPEVDRFADDGGPVPPEEGIVLPGQGEAASLNEPSQGETPPEMP